MKSPRKLSSLESLPQIVSGFKMAFSVTFAAELQS